MTITANHIRDTLGSYLDQRPEEKDEFAPVLALLADGADLTSRKEFRGHVTAGAVLLNPAGEMLLIHHLATGKWLTPGGHLEPADTSLIGAARRELAEETGIGAHVPPLADDPVHIDVHPIDAHPAKDEPAHRHIDVRFLFRLDSGDRTVSLQEEEVTGHAWRSLRTLTDERLRSRILAVLG